MKFEMEKKLKYKEIMEWWEKKRMFYNMTLIVFTIFGLIWDYRFYSNNEFYGHYPLAKTIFDF